MAVVTRCPHVLCKHKMHCICCAFFYILTWFQKVQRIFRRLGDMSLLKYTVQPYFAERKSKKVVLFHQQLFVSLAMAIATKSLQFRLCIVVYFFSDFTAKLNSHMGRIKNKTLQAIAPCHATDRRIAIHGTLQLLDALNSQLCSGSIWWC